MLTNVGEVMFKLNLTKLQCHPDATLAPPRRYTGTSVIIVNPHIQVLLTVLHVMTCLKVTKQCDHFHTFTTTLVILDVSAEEVSHT